MFLDTQESFSVAQAVTATGDTPSTNVLDTGAGDSGIGEPTWIYVLVNSSLLSATGTFSVVLQDSADNSAWADVQVLRTPLAQAALTARTELVRSRLPAGLRRYIRIVYRIATAVFTAGTVSAYLVKDVQAQQLVASGFVVA